MGPTGSVPAGPHPHPVHHVTAQMGSRHCLCSPLTCYHPVSLERPGNPLSASDSSAVGGAGSPVGSGKMCPANASAYSPFPVLLAVSFCKSPAALQKGQVGPKNQGAPGRAPFLPQPARPALLHGHSCLSRPLSRLPRTVLPSMCKPRELALWAPRPAGLTCQECPRGHTLQDTPHAVPRAEGPRRAAQSLLRQQLHGLGRVGTGETSRLGGEPSGQLASRPEERAGGSESSNAGLGGVSGDPELLPAGPPTLPFLSFFFF